MKSVFNKIKSGLIISYAGFISAYRREHSFRIELFFFVFLAVLAFFTTSDLNKASTLLAPCFLILACELLNSAIEKTIDELGQGRRCENFKYAKDCASASVAFLFGWLFLVWGIHTIDYVRMILC